MNTFSIYSLLSSPLRRRAGRAEEWIDPPQQWLNTPPVWISTEVYHSSWGPRSAFYRLLTFLWWVEKTEQVNIEICLRYELVSIKRV